MSSSDVPRVIGDYRLIELRAETAMVMQWEAVQVSVGRKVLVDELKPESFDQRELFMADVRAKAAIDHPLIASVYEAVDGEEECYYAHEYLTGVDLETRKEGGEPMKPLELSMLMWRVAEIHIMFENNGQSTAPMKLEHLYFDATGVLRVANLVVPGKRSEEESARDMTYLGHSLLSLVADGRDGSTRLLTLLAWMRGETEEGEQSLNWQQVIELCERIERQLTGEPTVRMIEAPISPPQEKPKQPVGLMVATGVLGLAVIILLMRSCSQNGVSKERVELPPPISIEAIAASEGQPAVSAFQISAHEVTIGQYLEFLETLERLKQSGNPKVFDHADQPDDKAGHEPDDWNNLLAAASKGLSWNGQSVTMDTPVVGVDWWDASAYCMWKKGRLPTEQEWVAALGMKSDQVAKIPRAGWGSVNPETADRSARGVLNMAGSVSEWTLLQTADPVNPLGAKKWLILGGSYKQNQSHALSREPLDERDLRRDDLGFRVVFD